MTPVDVTVVLVPLLRGQSAAALAERHGLDFGVTLAALKHLRADGRARRRVEGDPNRRPAPVAVWWPA